MRRPSAALVVASLALVFGAAGTSWATTQPPRHSQGVEPATRTYLPSPALRSSAAAPMRFERDAVSVASPRAVPVEDPASARTRMTATPPSVTWATGAGGGNAEAGFGVSALPDGSSIVTGYFEGTATFGSTAITSAGNFDVFVAKVRADGSWAWASSAGGSGLDSGQSVAALPDGSALVTGYFRGVATFGGTTLTSAGNGDVFIAKVRADGSWAWATRAGGSDGDAGYGVAALPDGSAIVTGSFVTSATFGTTTLTSAGIDDIFVAKVDANGSWVWAVAAGGTSGEYGEGISALPDGSSVVTGPFSGTATFGSTTLTSDAASLDVFVAKVRADGTWAWATRAGGSGIDNGYSVAALPDGSSVVTGFFRLTATFGSISLTSAGGSDIFVAALSADGIWSWATRAGGSGAEAGNAVSSLPDGSAIVTGSFGGTATFGDTSLTSAGGTDVFIAKATAGGTWVAAARAGGSGNDSADGLAVLPDGSFAITGFFSGTAIFGDTTLTSAGLSDVFVARYLEAPQAPAAPDAIAGDATATVSIAPLAGGSVSSYAVLASPGGATCAITAPATGCTVTGLVNGTSYTFTVTATNAAGTSPASAASNAVTPTSAPSPPTPTATTFTIDTAGVFRRNEIRLRVTVDGPGRFVIVGRYRLQGRPVRTACQGARTVAAAGTYTVSCRVNAATRMVLQRRPLRVGVRVTLTPTTGDRATKTKSVRLERTPARPVPVTG